MKYNFTDELRRQSITMGTKRNVGIMLQKAADTIDTLREQLTQEQRDHAATKAELERFQQLLSRRNNMLILQSSDRNDPASLTCTKCHNPVQLTIHHDYAETQCCGETYSIKVGEGIQNCCSVGDNQGGTNQ